ncbi:MAG: 6-phosphogluconolactonase [Deltaproteobacteria bacterium]|nr:6-phosphogluconolactonase [Deltaproteobacteria bacterium]
MGAKREVIMVETPEVLAEKAAHLFSEIALGADGHTASLFPGHAALGEQKKWVIPVTGGDPDVARLTMSFPVLNRARNVVFLVVGKEKARAVKSVLEDHDTRLPAVHVQPSTGSLIWILDRDAAFLLSKEMISVSQSQ